MQQFQIKQEKITAKKYQQIVTSVILLVDCRDVDFTLEYFSWIVT